MTVTSSMINVDLNAILEWLWDTERMHGVVTHYDNRYRYVGPIPAADEELDDNYVAAYQEDY
jgi:hypothetical protein